VCEPQSSNASALRSANSSERVDRSELVEELPRTHQSREQTARDFFGDRAGGSRDRVSLGGSRPGSRAVDVVSSEAAVEPQRSRRRGSGSDPIRLVGSIEDPFGGPREAGSGIRKRSRRFGRGRRAGPAALRGREAAQRRRRTRQAATSGRSR